MQAQLHQSNVTAQQLAHKEILSLLNEEYQLELKCSNIIINKVLFQIDGYTEKPSILCVICPSIGKIKVAQRNKITQDILKMLLIEKMKKKPFRKIIVFADEEIANSFSSGISWYSKIPYYFKIEIIVIDIPSSLKKSLLNSQKH